MGTCTQTGVGACHHTVVGASQWCFEWSHTGGWSSHTQMVSAFTEVVGDTSQKQLEQSHEVSMVDDTRITSHFWVTDITLFDTYVAG